MKMKKMPGFPMYAIVMNSPPQMRSIDPSTPQKYTSYQQSHKKHHQTIQNESLQNP
jgi:hypothetical protein